MRLTSLFEMPLATPRGLTRWSTLPVDAPSAYASVTTAYRARLMRRHRSSELWKNEPSRSLGMHSSTSPAGVD